MSDQKLSGFGVVTTFQTDDNDNQVCLKLGKNGNSHCLDDIVVAAMLLPTGTSNYRGLLNITCEGSLVKWSKSGFFHEDSNVILSDGRLFKGISITASEDLPTKVTTEHEFDPDDETQELVIVDRMYPWLRHAISRMNILPEVQTIIDIAKAVL